VEAAGKERDAGSGVAPVELVLFDLSGVLVHFRGAEQLRDWIGAASEEEAWKVWLDSEWMRRYDAGLCSAEEFASGAVGDWGLPIGPEEFLANFRDWLIGPYPGAEQLVRDVTRRTRVGCLSNMSALHWEDVISHWPLVAPMDPRLVSYQLGLTKPDRAIFEYAIKAIEPAPGAVLFLDDNLVNVEAALACGFQAERVLGVAGATAALSAHGLLG